MHAIHTLMAVIDRFTFSFNLKGVHCVQVTESTLRPFVCSPKVYWRCTLICTLQTCFLCWVHDDNFPLRDWFKQRGFILMYCWLLFVNLLWTLSGSVSVYSPFTTIFCSIWLSGIAEKMIRKNEQPEKPKQLFAFRSFRTCLSICHALHHFSICF